MKTQLLEDIGLSAPLSPVPPGRAPSEPDSGAPQLAQSPDERRARPRAAAGVWRQKPAGEPDPVVDQAAVQHREAPRPPEQAAAAEKVQVAPPPHTYEAVVPARGPTFSWDPVQSDHAAHDPLFDFTPPSPASPAPDLFQREPSWFQRSGRRCLLWGAGVVAGALAIQGGLWLSQERTDASSLALVVDESKAEPQIDHAVRRRAMVAKEFTLGSDGEVQVTRVAPPAFERSAAPKVPPLVLLEPETGAAGTVETADAAVAAAPGVQAAPKSEPAAAPAPPPARSRTTERAQAASAPRPVRTQVKPTVRETVSQREIKTAPGALSAETLKACREHGYHAAQCVKRACSVTKYGFVCRG